MDFIDRALKVIRLREAEGSSAAAHAAAGEQIAASMLRCMALEADEPDQLAKMQKAYNLWSSWVDMERKEIGTDADESTYIYEANADGGNLGSIIRLEERAVRADNMIDVKVIKPGWGTTGYYSDKVLERYAPQAFPAGTKMFWDHPTETESRERPERSLKDLAAELVTPAVYNRDGPDGPGAYARAKVFETYKGPVDELAQHIGTSIRAYGGSSDGEAEGRKGTIIESIIPSVMNSIDFVTLPGAGGQIVSIFEAARGRQTDADPVTPIQEATVGDENKGTTTPPPAPPSGVSPELTTAISEAVRAANEPILKELQETKQANVRLQESIILRDARDIVTRTVSKIPNVPEMTRTRLVESLSLDPPLKDGAIDTEAYATKITEAVTAELNYIHGAAGTGRVSGMGGSGDPGGTPTPIEESEKGLADAFGRLGLTEAEAKVASSGRAN